jgi:hypothetical protein
MNPAYGEPGKTPHAEAQGCKGAEKTVVLFEPPWLGAFA